MEFFGTIKQGAFTNVIPLEDGRYFVTIKKKNNRTNQQNKYWWSGVVPLVRQGLKDAGYNEVKLMKMLTKS